MISRHCRSPFVPLATPVALALLALCVGGLARPAMAHAQSLRRTPAAVHASAPVVVDAGWQIRSPNGAATTLGAYRGKIVFLHVWATWCVVCKPELASIDRLQRTIARSPHAGDVAFVLVSPESDRIISRYIKGHALAPHVFVEAQSAPRALGLTALPVTLILDRTGTVVARHQGLGAWDAPAFVTALQELVQSSAPTVSAK